MKFMHMRMHEPEVEGADSILLAHGGVTVAYEVKENNIEYAVAKCHRNDNFSRKIGRDISMGRFLAGQKAIIPLSDKIPIKALIKQQIYDEIENIEGDFDISYRLF